MNHKTNEDKLFSSSRDDSLSLSKDEGILFAPEHNTVNNEKKKWKILVVDDVSDVHAATHIILDDFSFDNRKTQIYDAYSAKEAKNILENENDIAVILLDVVMETNDAGLRLIEYCRNVLNNSFARIVLRTGQPGEAPEERVVSDYEISNYWIKTELTSKKMLSVMTAEIRTYSLMIKTEYYKQNLEKKIMERTRKLQAKKDELQNLLDNTLKGSIKVLIDILTVINPKNFNSSVRFRDMAKKLIRKLKPEKIFDAEISAILSQIGCVSVPSKILKKKSRGIKLLPEEEKLFNSHPKVGGELLKNIPRMEEIASSISNQMNSYDSSIINEQNKDIILISGILRIVIDFDILINKGISKNESWLYIVAKKKEYHPEVFNMMESVINETNINNTKKIV